SRRACAGLGREVRQDSELPALRVGLSLTNLSPRGLQRLDRLGQRRFVSNVQTGLRAVDLAHQSAQNFSWSGLDERLNTPSNQQPHALLPSDRTRDLPYERIERTIAVRDQVGVHVAYDGINRRIQGD